MRGAARLRPHPGRAGARARDGPPAHDRGRAADRRVRCGRRPRPRQTRAHGGGVCAPRRHRDRHVRQSPHRGPREDPRRRGSRDAGQAPSPRSGPPQGDRARAGAGGAARRDPARGEGPRNVPGGGNGKAAVRRADGGEGARGVVTVWTSARVAEALGIRAPANLTYGRVSTDTRQIGAGDLFVALKGDRFDAHDFLADARAKGAAAAVVRRGTPRVDGLPVFEVADTLVALGLLARARRRRLPRGNPVVAITGSSGKTGTKEMIRAVLATRYRTHATSGNLNNLVGVPLTILAAPEDAEALVVEAGASVPGEIARLRDVIEPTIAVITNVGYAHVEGFGPLEGVLREKLALVEGAGVAGVGTDPPERAREARRRTHTVVAGTAREADLRPDAADLDDAGHPRITWAGHSVTMPVLGFHQIENAMIALT